MTQQCGVDNCQQCDPPCDCDLIHCDECKGSLQCTDNECEKCFPTPPSPPPTWFWVLLIVAFIIITAIIICSKKVTHIIIFADDETKTEYIVTKREPLIIIADKNSEHENKYIVDCYGAFSNIDIAKIQATHRGIPLPRFYKDIKIIVIDEDELTINSAIETTITPPDNIAIEFTNSINERFTLKFECYMNSSINDKENDTDDETEEDYY